MTPKASWIPLAAICRRYPGSRGAEHVSRSTVTRWIVSGCTARDGRRVRLPATRCGARWLVRPADVDAFFAALAGGEDNAKEVPPTA